MSESAAAIRQVGAIPYRRSGGELQVLLVTATGSGRWIVPKGHLEPDLTIRETAAYEAFEEAGVTGRIGDRPAGSYTYLKRSGRSYRVRLYPLEVTRTLSRYPHAERRRRKWMSLERAIEAIHNPGLRRVIAGFAAHLRPETAA